MYDFGRNRNKLSGPLFQNKSIQLQINCRGELDERFQGFGNPSPAVKKKKNAVAKRKKKEKLIAKEKPKPKPLTLLIAFAGKKCLLGT